MPHHFPMKPLEDRSRNGRPLLSVVDDDESIRESLPDLIKEFGFCGSSFFLSGRVSLIRMQSLRLAV